MKENEFKRNVDELTEAVLSQVEAFMRSKGLGFNRAALLEQGSTDLDQFARDAFFFGADEYPCADAEQAA